MHINKKNIFTHISKYIKYTHTTQTHTHTQTYTQTRFTHTRH